MIEGDEWILELSWWRLLLDLALALVLTRMVGHVVDHRRPAAGQYFTAGRRYTEVAVLLPCAALLGYVIFTQLRWPGRVG